MGKCEIPGLNGVECEGHLGKFDDCLAEALWEWSLDSATDSAGASEFEGHVSLIVVDEDTPTDLSSGRVVIVPAGFYLVWTANSGAVTVTEVDSEQGGQDVIDVNAARYALWDAGCNPDDPGAHEDCGDFCRSPEWASA